MAANPRIDRKPVATALIVAVVAIIAVPVCMMFACGMGAMGHDCGLAGPLHCDAFSISEDGLIGSLTAILLFVVVTFTALVTASEPLMSEGRTIPSEVVVSRDPPGDRLNGRLRL